MRIPTLLVMVAFIVLARFSAYAEERPIKALMITGGCCHDYNRQKYSISEGLKLRCKVPIEWTIVHYKGKPGVAAKKDQRIPFYKNKDWAKGYDIVVHNECFAHERDPKWIEQILKPHRDGIPAVVMHCTMHSYGLGQVVPWVEFLGVSSPNHGPQYSYLVETIEGQGDHPITKAIGKGWQTPRGELYRINKVMSSATPLAHAKRQKTKQDIYDTCIWTNQFGKGRVFGTTAGHHNETVEDPVFQETLARGFLWALGRFNEDLLQDVKPGVLAAVIAQAKLREKKQQQDADKKPTPVDKVGVVGAGKTPASVASAHDNLLRDIKAQDEFDVTIFGAPPTVNYPVCLTTTPDGVVFVGVDENGSVGKTDGYGKVLRCQDTDGDGVADDVKVFAKMRHPRGLHFDNGRLWVLHPPFFTLYHDTDGDGVSDKSKTLLSGISTEKQIAKQGADHTTNGIRVGIDGWIYIAVGDFGYFKATDVEGKEHQLLGGGVVRVRPDGTELEVYSKGTRNICDMAIDPLLNVFTRDNTNDGGGWNIRVSYHPQSSHMGYPSLYKRFPEEHIKPLADLGGGSGTGAIYLSEPTLPAPYNNALLTADWGRNQIYYQPLTNNGAGFTMEQKPFLKISRPTDMDVDALGRIYVSSWKGGRFKFRGDNVGYVARLTPKGSKPAKLPHLSKLNDTEILEELTNDSHVRRLAAQWEIVRRRDNPVLADGLVRMVSGDHALAVKVAAIFTLKELQGAKATPSLIRMAKQNDVRETVLRALTDRKTQLEGLQGELIANALADKSPRVRAAAAVALGRLGDAKFAAMLLPLTIEKDEVVSHSAVKALVALQADKACLDAIGPEETPTARAALRVLRELHTVAAIDGLKEKLETVTSPAIRHEVLATLARLYYQEGEWPGDWWGTRPDTRGPYYRRGEWRETKRIASILKTTLASADADTARIIKAQLEKHLVKLRDISGTGDWVGKPEQPAIDIAKLVAAQKIEAGDIGMLSLEDAMKQTLAAKADTKLGEKLYTRQGCAQCHTLSPDAKPLGPMLHDIGKRYKPKELLESILKPEAKIAQGFATTMFCMDSGKIFTGIVTVERAKDLTLLERDGTVRTLLKSEIEERRESKMSVMPEGLVKTLNPQELASLLAYLQTLRSE